MAIIIDASVLYAALLKKGLTRFIIQNANRNFIAPPYIVDELIEHKNEICNRTGMNPKEFDKELSQLLKRIRMHVPTSANLILARELIGKIDQYDISYLAVAAYLKGSIENPTIIWANDKAHFREPSVLARLKQLNCIVMTTQEMKNQKLY